MIEGNVDSASEEENDDEVEEMKIESDEIPVNWQKINQIFLII